MKIVQNITLTREELHAAKDLLRRVAEAAKNSEAEANIDKHLRVTTHTRFTAGNVLSTLRLSDIYELVVEIEYDAQFTIELFDRLRHFIAFAAGMAPLLSTLNPQLKGFANFLKASGQVIETSKSVEGDSKSAGTAVRETTVELH